MSSSRHGFVDGLAALLGDVREHAVEGTRYPFEIERLDEERRIPDLAIPHESPELLLAPQLSLDHLLLKGAERAKLALGLDDLLDRRRPERAHELGLEVGVADEEAEAFEPGPRETATEARDLDSAPDDLDLARVAEARQLDAGAAGAEPVEEAADRVHASGRDDDDALGGEIPPAAGCQGLDGELVADALDEDDGACVMCSRERASGRYGSRARIAVPVRASSEGDRNGLEIDGGEVPRSLIASFAIIGSGAPRSAAWRRGSCRSPEDR